MMSGDWRRSLRLLRHLSSVLTSAFIWPASVHTSVSPRFSEPSESPPISLWTPSVAAGGLCCPSGRVGNVPAVLELGSLRGDAAEGRTSTGARRLPDVRFHPIAGHALLCVLVSCLLLTSSRDNSVSQDSKDDNLTFGSSSCSLSPPLSPDASPPSTRHRFSNTPTHLRRRACV